MSDTTKEFSRENFISMLRATDSKLADGVKAHTETARSLGQLREEIVASIEIVESCPGTDLPPSMRVPYTYGQQYLAHMHEWEPFSEVRTTTGSVITSGTAIWPLVVGAAQEIIPISGQRSPELRNALRIRAARDDREWIRTLLSQIEPSLGTTFISAWQSLESPPDDPTRGAAYLMRHVLSEAPRVLIDKHVGCRPNPDYQVQRIQLIADRMAKTAYEKNQLMTAAPSFRGAYENLNKAHSDSALDKEEMTQLLYAAQDLIRLLLESIELPVWVRVS
jgi:hypothetical protein